MNNKNKKVLYKVEVEDKIKTLLPYKWMRWTCGWIYLVSFALLFLTLPLCCVFLLPACWTSERWKWSIVFLAAIITSLLLPVREWPFWRKMGQLWYEIFDFHSNLSPETRERNILAGDCNQYIIGMYPYTLAYTRWSYSYSRRYASTRNNSAPSHPMGGVL